MIATPAKRRRLRPSFLHTILLGIKNTLPMPQPRPLRVAAEKAIADLRYESTLDPSPMASAQSRRKEPPSANRLSLLRLLAQMEPDAEMGMERDLLSDMAARQGVAIPLARELSTVGDGLGSGPLLSIEQSLRPPTLFQSLGSELVNIDADTDSIAALGAAQATWIGAGASATTTKMSTALSLLGKHELQIRLAVSRRLRNQVAGLEQTIRSEARRATQQAVERAVLRGADPNEPSGLYNSPAIPTAVVSALPTRAEMLAAVSPLLAIAPPQEVALILPSVQFAAFTGGANPIVEAVDGMIGAHHLAGLRVVFTPHLDTGMFLAGAWKYLTIAYLGAIEPALEDVYSQAASGQTIYTLFNTVGAAARQTAAFVRGVAS
jgi:hypothetical protein